MSEEFQYIVNSLIDAIGSHIDDLVIHYDACVVTTNNNDDFLDNYYESDDSDDDEPFEPVPPNTFDAYQIPDEPHPQLRDPTGLQHKNVYDNLKRAYKKAGNKWIIDHPRSIYSDLIRYGLRFYGKYEDNYARLDQVTKAIRFLHKTKYPYDIDCKWVDKIRYKPQSLLIYGTEGRFHDLFLFMKFFWQCGNAYKTDFFKWFIDTNGIDCFTDHAYEYHDYILSILFLTDMFHGFSSHEMDGVIILPNKRNEPCEFKYNDINDILDLLCDYVGGDFITEFTYCYILESFNCDIVNGDAKKRDIFEKYLLSAFNHKVPIHEEDLRRISYTFVYNPWFEAKDDYGIMEILHVNQKVLINDVDSFSEIELMTLKNCEDYIYRHEISTYNYSEDEFLERCGYYEFYDIDSRIPLDFVRKVAIFRMTLNLAQHNRYIYYGLKPRNLWNWRAWQDYESSIKKSCNVKLQFIIRNIPNYAISCNMEAVSGLIMKYC